MITILSISFRNNKKDLPIGKEKFNVALIYIGIMTENMLMSLCLDILQKPFTSFNFWHLRDLSMPHMTEIPQPMDLESNIPRQNRTYQPYTKLVHKESNTSRVPFYIIPDQSFPPCFPP